MNAIRMKLEEEFPNAESAFKLFKRRLNSHKRAMGEKRFASNYLKDTAIETKKKIYLEKMLPNLSEQEREKYIRYIYRCRFCDSYFPLWYVSDAEWENTGGQFERLIWSIAHTKQINLMIPVEVIPDGDGYAFKDHVEKGMISREDRKKLKASGLFLCKKCYEDLFNPKPRYLDIEEHEKEYPAESWKGYPPQGYFDWMKKRLSAVWDLPALKV